MPLVNYHLPLMASSGQTERASLDHDFVTVKTFDSREGKVRLVRHKGTDKLRIIKSVRHDNRQKPPREARGLARLPQLHPNIIRLFAAELDFNGNGKMLFEYCRGGDLLQQCERFDSLNMNVPPLFALHIWISVGEALAFLHHGKVHDFGRNYRRVSGHREPLVHCDIKEDNVFLKWPGQRSGLPDVVLSDFGLSSSHPTPGNGCVPYFSPECRANKVRHLTYKTDIYSFGVMMHQILNFRVGFWPPGKNPDDVNVDKEYKGMGFTYVLRKCLIHKACKRGDFSSTSSPGLLGHLADFREKRSQMLQDSRQMIRPEWWNFRNG
ncbi:hypothetical protein WHR41_00571 [Cladosporium halotolerans]|uniref:non-specific serine/threonine protein kinase n=1 Tax=Cladosporium halotolerans TaxID=1052096 RepID=A0AB34L098_9PEZI